MKRDVFLLIIVALASGCDDPCPVGLPCVRSCPSETQGLCNSDGLCLCQQVSKKTSASDLQAGSQADGIPSECAPPAVGDLIISEVLLDGEPTEAEEFIEIVNLRDQPIRLSGMSLWANRGQRIIRRVGFIDGCLEPRAALAMYADRMRWLGVPQPSSEIVAEVKRFGFSNSSDAYILLRGAEGHVIDEVSVNSDMIEPGISLTRVEVEDPSQPVWRLHNSLGYGTPSSPGLCPNGSRYDAGCIDPPNSSNRCVPPELGMLRINEVMIDGDVSESEEFVELINLTENPVSLAGLEIWSNRGKHVVPRVRFYAGCLPPLGMVALYVEDSHSIWRPIPQRSVDFEVLGFGFANQSDFHFELKKRDEKRLDVFSGSRTLIEPGVSINRQPDGYGDELAKHTKFTSRRSSPATCTTGHLHQFGCFVRSEEVHSKRAIDLHTPKITRLSSHVDTH